MDLISELWAFFLDANNRDALALIGGAVAAATGAIWAVATRRSADGAEGRGGDVYAGRQGVAAGRDVVIRHGLSGGRAALLAIAVAGALVAGLAVLSPRNTASDCAANFENVSSSTVSLECD